MTKDVGAVLTVRQAAERLQIGMRHVLTLLYEGKLPGSYKLGLLWQIPVQAIEHRLKKREGRHA